MFGRRTLKTVLAVITSLFAAQGLGLTPPLFAAIAAVLSIQPTGKRSFVYAKEQIQANIVGVLVSIAIVYLFGITIYSIALAILIVIGLNLFFKWENSIPLSLVTVIFIMESPSENFMLYAVNRFAITLLGIVIASFINIFLLPPKYVTHLRRQYAKALPLIVTYMAQWQNSGSFQPKLRTQLRTMIERTEELEQWMKEQARNQVQAPAYFRGLQMECEKNEILDGFLSLTELYTKAKKMPELQSSEFKEQFLTLHQQVVAVLSNSPLPNLSSGEYGGKHTLVTRLPSFHKINILFEHIWYVNDSNMIY
jgi:uncharacterized membrane protein YgaE (UPF0421/DUF939 family)